MKLRVGLAGTPAFALPALQALLHQHEVLVVLTQPDRPAGRGRAISASPIKSQALASRVPVLQPATLRTGSNELQATREYLAALNLDVLVVVAYGLILPADILRLPRWGCLNIHASLLPRWRGAAPIQRAILAGDTRTGIAIMQMQAGLDTGPVFMSRLLPIEPSATAESLQQELATLGAVLLLETLAGLAAGNLKPVPQPEAGVTYAEKLTRAESLIDWQASAVEIDRKVRALNPWPGTETRLVQEPIKILRSRVKAMEPSLNATPGQVLACTDDALEIACGHGVLLALQVQRAGRKAVSGREFFQSLERRGNAALILG
jgi:methionyl-tRNA formyltransferase